MNSFMIFLVQVSMCNTKFMRHSASHNLKGFKHIFNYLLLIVNFVISEKTINYCFKTTPGLFFISIE